MERIAIDAMGGDHAPEAPVAGALQAVHARPTMSVALVGDAAQIERLLGEDCNHPRIRVVPASEVIHTAEAPVQAVRKKPDSSMVQTIRQVLDGQADAVISAGNTGALMAAGLFILGRMPGIDRPALSALLPVFRGWGMMMLDVGANLDPKPQHLHQYGLMGSLYCQQVFGIDHPRVALLNVGEEESKGPPLVKDAYQLLHADPRIHFVGNVEGRELLQGKADVVVTDGFAGNIALKLTEGVARDVLGELKAMFYKNWRTKWAALSIRNELKGLQDRMDYQEYGAAPLLGLQQMVFKCHGASHAKAFRQAAFVAAKYIEKGSQDRMRERILEGDGNDPTGSGAGAWDIRSRQSAD